MEQIFLNAQKVGMVKNLTNFDDLETGEVVMKSHAKPAGYAATTSFYCGGKAVHTVAWLGTTAFIYVWHSSVALPVVACLGVTVVI